MMPPHPSGLRYLHEAVVAGFLRHADSRERFFLSLGPEEGLLALKE